HFVTDAQATSLPTRFAELAPRTPADVRIHAVGDARAPNFAVESFGGSALTGELAASVVSYAPQAVDKTVRLELNGETVAEQSVRLEPRGRSQAEFPPLELRSGANRVTVSIAPGDALGADDRRY